MKKKKLSSFIFLATVVLSIGGGKIAQAAVTNDVKEIEVELKYGRQEVEIDYEKKKSGLIKASYKNELTGERLNGATARSKIETLFSNVDIATDPSNVIAQALADQVNPGVAYNKIDFEAKYTNGRKVKFEQQGTHASKPAENATLQELEIEAKYGTQEIELEYEVKSATYVKTSYKNEVTGEYLTGGAAQAKIDEMIEGINLKQATQDEIIAHFKSKLNNGTTFRSFEFEAKYSDQTKIKFKR